MRREEIHQIEQRYKQDFIFKFHNTALGSYAGDIYDWYLSNRLPFLDRVQLETDKNSIEEMVRHCHELIIILADLRKSEVRWRNEIITDLSIPPEIEHTIQKRLLDYIEETGYTVGIGLSSDPMVVDAVRVRWGEALAWMPIKTSFEYDEFGRFTQDSFDDARERIEKCFVESQNLFRLTNGLLMRGMLQHIKKLGVPMTNKSYLQVYRCLEHFGWIPKDILDSHSKTTSRYVRENYIKAKFLRLERDGFDWDRFLLDPVELDKFNCE